MNLLVLMLSGCTPNDAEVTGTFHTWLADGSSGTIAEDKVRLGDATVLDCRGLSEEASLEGSMCPYDPASEGPEWQTQLAGDAYYLLQGDLAPWRTEAVITSEGDLQLTVHHDLDAKGAVRQDFRFAFVIDPTFQPTECILPGQTCHVGDEPTDDDGDGWADYDDPDCLIGKWEVGFRGTACNDGLDNDSDGSIDAADADCDHAWDSSEGAGDDNCSNGDDDDADGWLDGADPDCDAFGDENGTTNGFTDCNDGVDNDGDTLIDADDDGCADARDADEGGVTSGDSCSDDFDNDGDGWADADDPDCDWYGDEAGLGVTACNDDIDNDGDGATDAEDVGCIDAGSATEDDKDSSCTDGTDDDADGWIDTEDPDCVLGIAEDGTFAGLTECNDGVNNEVIEDTGDTAATLEDTDVDADDSDCQSAWDNLETRGSSGTCRDTDGVDEDGDGWVNEADPDCALGSNEIGLQALVCNDGLDNDGDGEIDADDPGCINAWRAYEDDLDSGTDCTDGVDNDGDGWVDTADGGCLFGDFEADGPITECSDGADNDGDGGIDGNVTPNGDTAEPEDIPDEPDCLSSLDTSESGASCEDDLDNDGDGWVDGLDPDCSSVGFEQGFTDGHCNDGVDNDGDGAADADDDGCLSATSEFELNSQCVDGEDNDGDGWTDAADPDCLLQDTPFEDNALLGISECNDGQDNDGDGLSDADDPDCGDQLQDGDLYKALDNLEATIDAGEPTLVEYDYSSILENWSEDEDGTIYYLNAAGYQINPSDANDEWTMPQEWLSGFGASKFAAEDFTIYPPFYQYMGVSAAADGYDPTDPDEAELDAAFADFRATAEAWQTELQTYGGMSEPMTYKVEDNRWRPVDGTESGLDLWGEMHSNWIRFDDGSDLTVGGSASGEFQMELGGVDAASFMVVRGTFEIAEIQEDKWTYGVLEDELREQNNTPVCE